MIFRISEPSTVAIDAMEMFFFFFYLPGVSNDFPLYQPAVFESMISFYQGGI